MGLEDRLIIEREFGPLWSGADSLQIGDRLFTVVELKRAFDMVADDIVGIDLHALPNGLFAFRHYDGDDRCVAVFVFDRDLNIVRELRAHIADWLEEDYYESGMEAFFALNTVKALRRKILGEDPPSP